MELIDLDTLIKVYEEYSFIPNRNRSDDVKELVEYCNSVKDYIYSIRTDSIEFYEDMLTHDNFLDRMVTLLYMFDNFDNISDMKRYKHIVDNNLDYILIKKINNKLVRYELEEAYYNTFKNEIISKKRNDILNQIL